MNFNKYKNISKPYDVQVSSKKEAFEIIRLLKNKPKTLGRSYGKIVSWHKGGGVKRKYRILGTSISTKETYALVRSINYNPNTSAFTAAIQLKSGEFAYVPVSSKTKINDIILFSLGSEKAFKFGDSCKLRYAPIGVPLYNIEKIPGSGAVYSKAAGVYSTLLTKDFAYGKIKLSSGEERLFDLNCEVTIGYPSNIYNKFHKKYKAGTNRLLNKRPTVRGVAMNPVDHPHGGGEGKAAPGRPSVSPWGKLTKNVPTRKKNIINKFIVKKR